MEKANIVNQEDNVIYLNKYLRYNHLSEDVIYKNKLRNFNSNELIEETKALTDEIKKSPLTELLINKSDNLLREITYRLLSNSVELSSDVLKDLKNNIEKRFNQLTQKN